MSRGITHFEKHINKGVYVRFSNGREIQGTLKGFDTMVNLVLDDCVEFLRDPKDFSNRLADSEDKDLVRDLGIVVCRGTAVTYMCPLSGMTEIDNPFLQDDEEEQQSDPANHSNNA